MRLAPLLPKPTLPDSAKKKVVRKPSMPFASTFSSVSSYGPSLSESEQSQFGESFASDANFEYWSGYAERNNQPADDDRWHPLYRPQDAHPVRTVKLSGGPLAGFEMGGPTSMNRRLHNFKHGSPTILPKLEVGDVNNPLEREADEIADEVMRMPEPTTADDGGFSGQRSLPGSPGFVAHRKCASCEAEDDELRRVAESKISRACSTCEDEDELRRACASCEAEDDELLRASASCDATAEPLRREPGAGLRGGGVSDSFGTRVRGRLRLGGLPLSSGVRSFLEPRFGVELEWVRVHTDAEAGSLARKINARAFTCGQDIFFAPGELRPQTHSGMRLLAHEVAHTLQGPFTAAPTAITPVQRKLQLENADPENEEDPEDPERYEREVALDTTCGGHCASPTDAASIRKAIASAANRVTVTREQFFKPKFKSKLESVLQTLFGDSSLKFRREVAKNLDTLHRRLGRAEIPGPDCTEQETCDMIKNRPGDSKPRLLCSHSLDTRGRYEGGNILLRTPLTNHTDEYLDSLILHEFSHGLFHHSVDMYANSNTVFHLLGELRQRHGIDTFEIAKRNAEHYMMLVMFLSSDFDDMHAFLVHHSGPDNKVHEELDPESTAKSEHDGAENRSEETQEPRSLLVPVGFYGPAEEFDESTRRDATIELWLTLGILEYGLSRCRAYAKSLLQFLRSDKVRNADDVHAYGGSIWTFMKDPQAPEDYHVEDPPTQAHASKVESLRVVLDGLTEWLSRDWLDSVQVGAEGVASGMQAWFVPRKDTKSRFLLVTPDFYRGDLWLRVSTVAEAVVRGLGRRDDAAWLARLATAWSKRAMGVPEDEAANDKLLPIAREIVQRTSGTVGNTKEKEILALLQSVDDEPLDHLLVLVRNLGGYDALFDKFQGRKFKRLVTMLATRLETTDERVRLLNKVETSRKRQTAGVAENLFKAAQADNNLDELFEGIASHDRGEPDADDELANEVLEQLAKRMDAYDLEAYLRAPYNTDASAVPGRRVLGPMDLTEVAEGALVKRNGGKGVLLPYGGFDAAADPLIIVHGMLGSAIELKKIIDRYVGESAIPKKQVYIFLYDDLRRSIDRSGDDLAQEIEKLRVALLEYREPVSGDKATSGAGAASGDDPASDEKFAVEIIAHSMGGIVSRAALNSMTAPAWFSGTNTDERSQPLANTDNFEAVELVTIDSPWSGGAYRSPASPARGPRRKVERRQNRWTIGDMVAKSPLMQDLHEAQLDENVELHSFEAAEDGPGRVRHFRTLRNLDDAQMLKLRDFVLLGDRAFAANGEPTAELNQLLARGERPGQLRRGDPALLNQFLALSEEASYPELKGAIERESEALEREDKQLGPAEVRTLVQQHILVMEGNHVTVLDNPKLHEAINHALSDDVGSPH
jgi:hypothetical protein